MRRFNINKQITNHSHQSISKYLTEIGRIALVSAEEETTLAKKIKEGDQQALQKLIRANLRFVVSVAKQFQGNTSMTLGDLISEGNIGLMKAATRFDETKGFKFISYAVWWIRQSIMSAVAEQTRIVRLPINKIASIAKISKTYTTLEQKLQREPLIEELSESLKTSPETIRMDISFNGRHVSLDAPFISNEESSLADILVNENALSPDSSLMADSLKEDIQRAFILLSKRETEVISYYYGLNGEQSLNLEEIATIFNLTRERVRQIKEKAILRLRRCLLNTNITEGYPV